MSLTFEEKYEVIAKIGEGSFSEVLKIQDRVTAIQYAAKKLKKRFKSIHDIMQCAEIIATQKLCRHPNVLYMLQYIYDSLAGKVVFIFELMDMSMYEHMKQRKRFPENKVRIYLYQMLKGLAHLHDNGLFHRDIKPENILIKLPTTIKDSNEFEGELIKLADLGSIRGSYSQPPYTEYISTRWYRSPECLLTMGNYGPKMDVWAVGCVFFEMLTMKPLFPGSNEIDQLSRIHALLGSPSNRLLCRFRKRSRNFDNFETFPHCIGSGLGPLLCNISEESQSILKLMLQYDPEARSNVRRLLENKYFSRMRDDDFFRKYKNAERKAASFQKDTGDSNCFNCAGVSNNWRNSLGNSRVTSKYQNKSHVPAYLNCNRKPTLQQTKEHAATTGNLRRDYVQNQEQVKRPQVQAHPQQPLYNVYNVVTKHRTPEKLLHERLVYATQNNKTNIDNVRCSYGMLCPPDAIGAPPFYGYQGNTDTRKQPLQGNLYSRTGTHLTSPPKHQPVLQCHQQQETFSDIIRGRRQRPQTRKNDRSGCQRQPINRDVSNTSKRSKTTSGKRTRSKSPKSNSNSGSLTRRSTSGKRKKVMSRKGGNEREKEQQKQKKQLGGKVRGSTMKKDKELYVLPRTPSRTLIQQPTTHCQLSRFEPVRMNSTGIRNWSEVKRQPIGCYKRLDVAPLLPICRMNVKETSNRQPTFDNNGKRCNSFRKTTSNLPQLVKRPLISQNPYEASVDKKEFQSKSFVLPKRIQGRYKLDTIVELNGPQFRQY